MSEVYITQYSGREYTQETTTGIFVRCENHRTMHWQQDWEKPLQFPIYFSTILTTPKYIQHYRHWYNKVSNRSAGYDFQ